MCLSPLVQWLVLWFCDLHVAVKNPIVDLKGYELFVEIAPNNPRFLFLYSNEDGWI